MKELMTTHYDKIELKTAAKKFIGSKFVDYLPLPDKYLMMAQLSMQRNLRTQMMAWAKHYILHNVICANAPDGAARIYWVDERDIKQMALVAYSLHLKAGKPERARAVMERFELNKMPNFREGKPRQPELLKDRFAKIILESKYYAKLAKQITDKQFESDLGYETENYLWDKYGQDWDGYARELVEKALKSGDTLENILLQSVRDGSICLVGVKEALLEAARPGKEKEKIVELIEMYREAIGNEIGGSALLRPL